MDWNTETVKTYDNSAQELADYFSTIGVRTDDIELALKLAAADKNARVVEIGCGDGRDAQETVKHVGLYEGYDPSEGLLQIARKQVPEGSFVKADALTYDYPSDLDVIYAFASLLHVNKTDMKMALAKAATGLRKGGILFVSLKERPAYEEVVKEDKYGKRMFYYYNAALIKELASEWFTPVSENHYEIARGPWFKLALQKK